MSKCSKIWEKLFESARSQIQFSPSLELFRDPASHPTVVTVGLRVLRLSSLLPSNIKTGKDSRFLFVCAGEETRTPNPEGTSS